MQLIARIVTRGNTNLPALRCKLQRIFYKVPKDLLESRWVRSQMDSLCGEIELKRQMLLLDLLLANLESIAQERMSVNNSPNSRPK